jgi:hypothetical protein
MLTRIFLFALVALFLTTAATTPVFAKPRNPDLAGQTCKHKGKEYDEASTIKKNGKYYICKGGRWSCSDLDCGKATKPKKYQGTPAYESGKEAGDVYTRPARSQTTRSQTTQNYRLRR